ncbi:uncharacterized protein BXIN_1573 [Babesia sp. Xinjiang]|uniref:uncharacterized protein n=1 Tax=Babesia sp. Xinjiang TaxID=462227 RepID=UPI000A2412B1|nr:uncharacterized protein BXIN_1573 [Babesia sp. Xinjiang]ORM42389.1 hypothetical protein BXIN_1573 [Babesia sp. Xinjiang]
MRYLFALIAALAATTVGIAHGNITAREVLKRVDLANKEEQQNSMYKYTYEDANGNTLPFCAKLSTIVWCTDDEINQASNVPALFDILKLKFAARAQDHTLAQQFGKLTILSALARLICQGKVQVIENNVQNETKNIRITAELKSPFNNKQEWESLVSYTTELSLYLSDDTCPIVNDAEDVDIEKDTESTKFENIAFKVHPVTQEETEPHTQINNNMEPEVKQQETEPHTQINNNMEPEVKQQENEPTEITTNLQEEPIVPEQAQKLGQETTPVNEEKQYNSLTQEQETKFMDKFEQLDMKEHTEEEVHPLHFKIYAHVVTKNDDTHKDIITKTTILLKEADLKQCKDQHFYGCIREVKKTLFNRYEDQDSKEFVRGHFITLLQLLMLQGDIYVTPIVSNDNGLTQLTVFVTQYTTNFFNFKQWKKLTGDAHSTDQRIDIGLDMAAEPLNKPEDSQMVKLGNDYPVDDFEKKFLENHQYIKLDQKQEENENNKQMEEQGESQAHTEEEQQQTPPKKTPKPESHQDMHRVLSSYERALMQVPREINGYQLAYSDIEDYPNLQQIWRLGLTTMKLMKEDEDLKTVLEKQTFTYDQLKELFNFSYGVIAVNQYEEARDFYESAKIPKEAVETSLTMVQNLFKANTGTNITRLPPIIKKMAHTCPVKDMIISLSTDDLIDRLHIMIGTWIESFEMEENPEGNFQLAALCSAAAVVVQQWRYMQLSQGYHEEGDAWVLLMQSFSRMGQSKSEQKEVRERYKRLINSRAAKQCRKYINQAGAIAYASYKGIARNYNPLSLTGAIGNVLDQNMEASTDEIVGSLRDYFSAANIKNRIGNALGVCISLQVMNKMHSCLAVEQSNDYSLYKLDLLTKDTSHILESFTSANVQIEGKDVPQTSFVHMACDLRDGVVEEALDKLFKLLSNEGNTILIETLNSRNYFHPKLDDVGQIVDDGAGDDWLGEDYVQLEDAETLSTDEDAPEKNKEGSENAKPVSFLELQDEQFGDDGDIDVDMEDEEPANDMVDMIMNERENKDQCLGQKQPVKSVTIYDKIMNDRAPHGIISPDDMRTIMFDFRMISKFDDETLKSLMVPLVFQKWESDYLRRLHAHEYPTVLMRKLEERMDKMKKSMPTDDLLHHVRSIANLEGKDEVSISLDKHTIDMNRKLNDCKNLLQILSEIPHDGFYFEGDDGKELPFHQIGEITARSLQQPINAPQMIVMQIIDPVHIDDSDELFTSH